MDNDMTEVQELRARVDRLERMVDLLGTWGHMDKLADRYMGKWDDDERSRWTSRYSAEFDVLNPLNSDAMRLTYVLDCDGQERAPRQYLAGCMCLWSDYADTADEARALAVDHVSSLEHCDFVDLYPHLAGPEMPQEVGG